MGLLDMAGSGIAGGLQALIGVGQTIAGLAMPKPEIPEYDIPQEVYQNMTDAEYWSFMGLPEAQKQQYVEQSRATGAQMLSQSASRKGGLGMVSSIAQQQQEADKALLTADAQARMQNIQNLWNARNKMVEQKGIQQEWGRAKTMEIRGERKEMLGAGMQNLVMGAGSFLGSYEKGMFGGGKKGVVGGGTSDELMA